MAAFVLGLFNRLGQFGAQRVAIEMAGEFVAVGQIGEALIFARPLGGVAQDADQPLGAAVLAGDARARHAEIERAHRRSDFDVDLEIGGVERTGIQDVLQEPTFFLRDGVDQDLGAIGVEMQRKRFQRAVPHNGAVRDVPVERSRP